MREIKFRAWDEQNKIMHNEVEFIRSGTDRNDWILFKSDKQKLECGNVLNNPYFQQQIKIMQFTRLFDKQGIEIYEDDIIIVTEEDKYSSIDSKFIFKGVVSDMNYIKISAYAPQYLLFNERWSYEVIGNIYENPELLKDIK